MSTEKHLNDIMCEKVIKYYHYKRKKEINKNKKYKYDIKAQLYIKMYTVHTNLSAMVQ